MPEPLAICIEDLDAAPGAPRYLRCTAVVGRQPGLGLDATGAVLWRSDAGAAAELWVSGDDQLILYRPEGAPECTVRRAGRAVVAPVGKPVVLRDQDEVDVSGRHLRVHVHGPAPEVTAPAPLPESPSSAPFAEEHPPQVGAEGGPGVLARAAAALALGAALGAGGCVEVRNNPPDMAPPPRPHDAGVAAKPTPPTNPGPIEVRPAPPAVAMPPQPPAPPTKPGEPPKPTPPKPAPKPDSK
jgi:hypothetical protein